MNKIKNTIRGSNNTIQLYASEEFFTNKSYTELVSLISSYHTLAGALDFKILEYIIEGVYDVKIDQVEMMYDEIKTINYNIRDGFIVLCNKEEFDLNQMLKELNVYKELKENLIKVRNELLAEDIDTRMIKHIKIISELELDTLDCKINKIESIINM